MPTDTITTVEKNSLIQKVSELNKAGYRLVHICANTLADTFELTYAFDKEYGIVNLRLMVPKADPVVPSITGEFLCALTYENELQDLFGLKVTDLKVNFNGNFYRTAIKTPFAVANPQTGAK
jgi:ech hydrogenase subunit D